MDKSSDREGGGVAGIGSQMVLSLDGLSTAALGPYGCSWLETPGICRLAAEAVVFERCTAISTNRLENLRSAMRDAREGAVGSCARQAGFKSILITDSETVAQSTLATDFDECHWVPSDCVDSEFPQMADSFEETRLAKLIAAAFARREACNGDPHLIWIHSSFLLEHWDAPEEFRIQDDLDEFVDRFDGEASFDAYVEEWTPEEDEGEPNTEELSELLAEIQRARLAIAPPEMVWSDRQDSDLLLAWMTAYGAQIQIVDRMLEVILDEIASQPGLATTLAILSTGGFALGENGWLGANPPAPSSIQNQLTCIFRLPGKLPLRVIRPVASDRIAATLIRQLLASEASYESCSMGSEEGNVDSDNKIGIHCGSLHVEWAPEQWAMPIDPVEFPIRTIGDGELRGTQIVTTHGWFYWASSEGQEHLFLKPDDRFDANDVAKLKPELLEMFRGDDPDLGQPD